MKVLQCHNFYQQPGGEDRVLAEEKALLEKYGHTVEQHVAHNDEVSQYSKLSLFGKTLWSKQSHHAVRETVERFRPDVVHVHNTMPLLSPSIYSAARSTGAAVVQTLHNYRMICPGAYCQRGGEPCELCVNKTFKWPAIQHACYRENRAATASIVAMLALHNVVGTYRKSVDHYIVCSEFARKKMISAGFTPDRVTTKPNFQISDIGVGPGDGGYAMYLGRLSPEKGVQTMLDAWDRDGMDVPLHIIGGGPMQAQVREVAQRRPAVTCLGHLPWAQVEEQMRRAALLVFPSVTYEGHPMTLLESMQAGTPMVGSRLGAIPEIIDEDITGRCVTSHNPDALASAVTDMMSNPVRLQAMRADVRRVYDQRYAVDTSHQRLIAVYERAIEQRQGQTPSPNADTKKPRDEAPAPPPCFARRRACPGVTPGFRFHNDFNNPGGRTRMINPQHAVILAGGKGRRLHPYTINFPKPLAPVADMPILDIVIRQLKHAGFKEFTFAVGHLAELLMAYFGDGSKWDVKINYSREEKPLGTVAPLTLIDNLPEQFLVMNGDVLSTIDYRQLYRYHIDNEAELTIACHRRQVKIDLGVIEFDHRMRVTGYREKPTLPYDVSMGVYIFNRSVLDLVPPDEYTDLPTLVHRLMENGRRVKVFLSDCEWLDIGRPEDYAEATEFFMKKRREFLPAEVDVADPLTADASNPPPQA